MLINGLWIGAYLGIKITKYKNMDIKKICKNSIKYTINLKILPAAANGERATNWWGYFLGVLISWWYLMTAAKIKVIIPHQTTSLVSKPGDM